MEYGEGMKFSVLIPTRNRLQYLTHAVETVTRQDYPDWEIIISDNFSQEDVGQYVESLNDSRIKYYRTSSFISVTDNWNNAIEKATGDYVIMLGDDDALLPGYFTTALSTLEKFAEPELLYTGAYLFAYPNAIPEHPEGYLTPYSYAVFFGDSSDPFVVPRTEARRCVENAFNFRCRFGFNMQFFVLKRQFIESLRSKGPFFQSPFPDYYAANVSFWMAERIVALPHPIVVIGITPKSYGSFHHRQKVQEGVDFLRNTSIEAELEEKLSCVVLPGSNINTSWLFSMEHIRKNYGSDIPVNVNHNRYRFLQILYMCRNGGRGDLDTVDDIAGFNQFLSSTERLWAWGITASLWLVAHAPGRMRHLLKRLFKRLNRQYVDYAWEMQSGVFTNMLEVFEAFSEQPSRERKRLVDSSTA